MPTRASHHDVEQAVEVDCVKCSLHCMFVYSLRVAGAGENRLEYSRIKLDASGQPKHEPSAAMLTLDGRAGTFEVTSPFPRLTFNGAPATHGTLVAGGRFEWGECDLSVIEVEAPPEFDPEALGALLADSSARAVFVDWVESQGALRCAEYARLVAQPRTELTHARLAELTPQVWRYFREVVACVPIRRCGLEFCPKQWEAIAVTRAAAMRKCPGCKRYVQFAPDPTSIPASGPFVLEPSIVFQPEWERSRVIVGRPLLVDGVTHAASLATQGQHTALHQAAADEHAAIATFARTLCELMARGAPLELIKRTQAALADEVRHTEMTLNLLKQQGNSTQGFGPLRAAVAPLERSLADFIADVRAGAESERLATEAAQAQADAERDEERKAFYQTLATDEARHAQLALDTVSWLETQVKASG